MLNSLRQSAASLVAKILIGLLVLSFAVWGIADIFGGYGVNAVANVGEKEISAYEFQRSYQSELNTLGSRLGRAITPQQARGLGIANRILSRLIGLTAMDNHAEDLKLGITDKAIAENIVKDRSFHDQDGKFNRQQFQYLLRNNGLTEQTYIISQRQTSLRNQLRSIFTQNLMPTKTLVSAVNRFQNEKRSIAYFVVSNDKLPKIGEPSEADLKKYFDSRKREFTAPEYRKAQLLIVDPQALKTTIEVSDKDVKAAYDAQINNFTTPATRRVLQMSFTTLKDAEETYKKLQSGGTLLDIAKEKKLNAKDIDLGEITKNKMVDKKAAEVAFALPKTGFSKPIDGQFSKLIVQVTKITPEVVKKFEDVKKDLHDRLALDKATNEVADLYDAIEDDRGAGMTLAEIAKKNNLKFVEIAAIDRAGKGPNNKTVADMPPVPTLLPALFRTKENVENDPLEALGGGYIWYDIVGVQAAKLKDFEKIKTDVAKSWRLNEQRQGLRKKSQAFVDQGNKGKSLDELAKAAGAKIQTLKAFKRRETPKGVSSAAVNLAFALTKDGFASAAMPGSKDRIVFQVKTIEKPPAPKADEMKRIETSLSRGLTEDFLSQYIAALQNNYTVKINTSQFDAIAAGRSLQHQQRY